MPMKYYCGKCSDSFFNAGRLFEHFRTKHPDLNPKDWASSFTTGYGYSRSYWQNQSSYERRSYQRQSYSPPPPRPPPEPIIKPSLIAFMESRGRNQGEIQAFVNIASKFSGLSPDEIKRLKLS